MGQIGLLGLIGFVFHFLLLGFLNLNNRGEGGAGGGDQEGQGGQGQGQGQGSGDGKGGQGQGQGQGQQGQGQGQQGQGQQGQGTFAIPDAYKDKGWAKKVKTQEDVFKLIDSQDVLIGKKVVVPDLENGDPKEIEAYLVSLRGETKVEDYVFPEGSNKDITAGIGKLLFDSGMPKALANKIIKGYSDIEQKVIAAQFSADSFEAILKESFGKEGGDYKKISGNAINFTKQLLSDADKEFLNKQMPNAALGVFYRFANEVIKKFGISESDVSGEGDGAGTGKGAGDVKKRADELRKQIAELSKKSHLASDKKKLVDELNSLYEAKK